MDTFQAVEIRDQHNKDVKRLNRATMPTLRDTYAAVLRQRDVELVSGGPVTRDELVNAILGERYPRAQMDEVTHVLYHRPGENWSACSHCNPRHECEECGWPLPPGVDVSGAECDNCGGKLVPVP